MITLLATGLLASIIVLLPALLFSVFRSRLGMALRGARKDESRLAGLTVAAFAFVGGAAAVCSLGGFTFEFSSCGACETVRQSVFSSFAGLPMAAWGVIGYSLIALVWCVWTLTNAALARVIVFVLVVGALVASACLVWIQASVLRTFCPLCLVSAVSSIGAAVALLAADSYWQVSRYQKAEVVPVVNRN